MKQKQLLPGLGASIGILILILDGQTALQGAQDGIKLCIDTVIPSLFPFFILSILLTSSLSGFSLTILRPLGKLCGVPKGAEALLVSGFLGGYPAGAQCISAAYQAGNINKSDAERMLAFCSNAGPAFLFGMVSAMFPSIWFVWVLWGIHIASALLVGILLPGKTASIVDISYRSDTSLPHALRSATTVTATVCGWVILFRVMIAFCKRWFLWLLSNQAQVLFIGLMELSNGCCELLSVSDVSVRFIICSGILAFGGLCVTMQTLSVIGTLSHRSYILGKLMQTLFSLILSFGVIYRQWIPCFFLLLISMFLLQTLQKNSSIQDVVGV